MHYKPNMEGMDMTKKGGGAQNINCDMILWSKQII